MQQSDNINKEQSTSKFWPNQVANELSSHYPKGEIVVSSGISPSAHYHIGHFREILTAEAICWQLRRDGRMVKHIHVIDDFDPLRRRYDFLPEEFERYVGWPIHLVPDPEGNCHTSYAEHFFANFEAYSHLMGVKPTEVVANSSLYKSGKMTFAIENTLEKIDQVKEIFARISNRQLGQDWTPVQVIMPNGSFEQGRLSDWNKSAQTINGISYSSGLAKLNWRLEWPARWQILGVMVEPFSHQEHGAAGGSYDTGVELARQIFGFEPPVPGVRYGNIHIKGDSKKMSSSKGNLYTPAQVLEVMPAEILRYFVIKSRPEKQLDFDLHEGLYNLLEEFSKTEEAIENSQSAEFAEAVEFARDLKGGVKRTISGVPFNHLVFAWQTARGDKDQVLAILERTGFSDIVKRDKDTILIELGYVEVWLNKYAPDKIKFDLQDKCPEVDLDQAQVKFLELLTNNLQDSQWQAQIIHDSVYQSATEAKIKPGEAFKLLYLLFLNKPSGPKIGYFLSSLSREFVLARLKRQA